MTKNPTIILRVSEMSCGACERRIEKELSELPGIITVKASYGKSTVEVEFDNEKIADYQIKEKLEALHYPVVDDNEIIKSKMIQWGKSALILGGIIIAYKLLERTGVFNLFPMPESNTALPALFFMGLLTSVHCIAMCGGINISQCAKIQLNSKADRYSKIVPSLLYNSGRVVSYTIIGGIVGALGGAITPTGSFRGVIAVGASVFMIIMGMNMLGMFLFLHNLVPRMPKFIVQKISDTKKINKGPFVVGLLNGLMPCGPLQAMQLYALSTGSPILGALSMFLFSIGTVPLMFGLGALSTFLSGKFTSVMLKVSAILVILLGLMMLNTGLTLSGFNPIF